MVFMKLTAQVNIHESILNMGFKEMTWLWLSLAEVETQKTPIPKSIQQTQHGYRQDGCIELGIFRYVKESVAVVWPQIHPREV